MASLPAWGYPLGEPAVRHFLDSRIDPAKTEALLDDFDIGDGIRPGNDAPAAGHPAMAGRGVVRLQPFSQLLPFSEI